MLYQGDKTFILALQLYLAFQFNTIQTSTSKEDKVKFKLFGKTGTLTEEEVSNKLPKLKRKLPGLENQFVCTTSSSRDEGGRNWVSFLEKAIVQRLCSGTYQNLKDIGMLEIFRCLVGPVPA